MSDPGHPANKKLVIWPEGIDLAPVKAAALSLGLPYKIMPFWFDARYNDDSRVLVLADGFEYSTIVDRIYPRRPDLLADAILWCLHEKELERGPVLANDTMKKLLGAEFVGIWHEKGEEPGEDDPW